MKTNLRFSFLFIIVFFTCGISISQNFESGYIVSFQNDTIYGLINNKDWDRSPVTIEFKKNESSPVMQHSVKSINAFMVGGYYYEKFIAKVDISPVKESQLTYDKKYIVIKDTVFMSSLLKSSEGLSLYRYSDSYGKEHFYIQSDTALIELLVHRYMRDSLFEKQVMGKVDIYRKPLIVVEKVYREQLYALTSDCTSFNVDDYNEVSYAAKSLQNFIGRFNNCEQNKIEYRANIPGAKLQFGVIAGATLSTLKINGITSAEITYADFSNSLNATGGISLNIIFPRNNRQWSLFNDLIYTTYHVTSSFNLKHGFILNYHNFDFRFANIELLSAVRYQIPEGRFRPFIQAGIINSYSTRTFNQHQYAEINSDGTMGPIQIEAAFVAPKKYKVAGVAGIGLRIYNHFTLGCNAQVCNNMSGYSGIGAREVSLSFLAGFEF